MANLTYTQALASEYDRLYTTCEIRPSRFAALDRIADRVVAEKRRYVDVGRPLGVPWFFIAAIHNLESAGRFDRHMHNGDSLRARTRHIPAGRPVDGDPPFTWEESARDAFQLQRLNRVDEWPLPRLLYQFEKYNGWGYRVYHPTVLSPYLWGFSGHYSRGKYVADGRWSDTAVSAQCGAAVLVRRLEERGDIPLQTARLERSPFFAYGNRIADRVDDLQRFLNGFEGIRLRVDGKPGSKTSDAVRKLFGHRLSRDPRN